MRASRIDRVRKTKEGKTRGLQAERICYEFNKASRRRGSLRLNRNPAINCSCGNTVTNDGFANQTIVFDWAALIIYYPADEIAFLAWGWRNTHLVFVRQTKAI